MQIPFEPAYREKYHQLLEEVFESDFWSEGPMLRRFEEEFERACKRREQTEAPEVWLFLKEVDAENVDDPGEQLRRVLDFRRRQVQERRVLFKEFSTPEDWQNKFHDFLTRFVVDLGVKSLKRNFAASVSERSVVAPVDTVTDAAGVTNATEGEEVSQQLSTLSNRVHDVITSGDPVFVRDIGDIGNPGDEFHSARLYLLGASWMSVIWRNGELIPTHSLNILYRYRDSLNLVASEQNLLFETILDKRSQNCPGWYWFRELDSDRLTNHLIDIRPLAEQNLENVGLCQWRSVLRSITPSVRKRPNAVRIR